MPAPSLVTRMFYGTYEFSPVPLLSWGTELSKDSKGESLFLRKTLELDGTLLELAGESGQFPGLMDQRAALQSAVEVSGVEFQIWHQNEVLVSGIYPTLESVNFDQGTWTTQIPYTITFTYNEQFEDKPPIESFDNTWSFEEVEENPFIVRVSHDISAVGVNTAPSGANNALSNAKDYVLGQAGAANIPAGFPAFTQASGTPLTAFETIRTESLDIQAGSYGVNESFILSSGAYTHNQSVQYQTGEDGITSVTMEGNIKGLGRKHTAFPQALSAWSGIIKPRLPTEAVAMYARFGGSGTLFANNPRSISLSQNEYAGTLNYSYVFDDDVSGDLPEYIQDASVSVSNSEPLSHIAVFQIPDRALGPIYQDVNTTTEGTYTISGNITGKQGVDISLVKAYAQQKINENLPGSQISYQDIRLSTKSVTVDEIKNTVSFNITWNYTQTVASVDVGGGGITIQ